MPNHLANETSPYLRQHKDNPVNWYPWGEEALSKAREENKPIFLSIGYAACHWCHVMAHESFEDTQTAEILNQNFICIKVDREERPDLDDIYMQAVMLLTGQGGWPMSVFLTPDLQPFYGGTYFPPSPRHGMPAFNQVLLSVIDAWNSKTDAVIENARSLTQAIQNQNIHKNTPGKTLDLDAVVETLHLSYDWNHGGWGSAPKFPQPMVIEFLTQRALSGNDKAMRIVSDVLDRMARGGMYDLVGGGFHRYSTDADWLVPHFEKMLYDNAQLAQAYLHGYALTGNPFFRQIAVETLAFIQRELSHPDGGFYASLDADTPEGEGRHYTWRAETLRDNLTPEEFKLLKKVTNFNPNGNYEAGLIILQYQDNPLNISDQLSLTPAELKHNLAVVFSKLSTLRSERTPPARDEKIITAWNALAIIAFTQAGLLLGRNDFLETARLATAFILKNLKLPDGRLQRVWSQGKTGQPAALEDYAGLVLALHALYEVDFSSEHYQTMRQLHATIHSEFSSETALYYDAASSVSDLIIRPQSLQDNATPSGNALAAQVHWLLSNYDHDQGHSKQLSQMISQISERASQYPASFGYWLQIADLLEKDTHQVALVSNGNQQSLDPFLSIYRQQYRPHSIIAAKYAGNATQKQLPRLLNLRPMIDDKPTAYVCQGFTCRQPVNDPEDFKEQITSSTNL